MLSSSEHISETKTMRRIVSTVLAAGLLLVTGSSSRDAVAQQDSPTDVPTFVVPPDRPTEVEVGFYLLGLSHVSEPSEAFPTFQVEMFIDASWKDPRLAYSIEGLDAQVFLGEEAREKLTEIWTPDVEIQNEVEQRQTESVQLTIFPDGTIKYEERFGAELNAELDLKRFPFDTQTFDLELQSFVWDSGDLVFVANELRTGFDPDFQTPEWYVTSTEALVAVRSEIRDDREFSTYIFRINASRHSGHYMLRFMLPLFFVMMLTWISFWQPADKRLRVGFIALLTVVASHTVISQDLPRLHYPTFADVVLIVCYAVASALIVESIWVQRLEESGSGERAKTIDRRVRWVLPAAAAIILGVSLLALWS
jgi:hypothetical protein